MHIMFPGWQFTEEHIQEAATASGVSNVHTDFLTPEFRAECERFIPNPEEGSNLYKFVNTCFLLCSLREHS